MRPEQYSPGRITKRGHLDIYYEKLEYLLAVKYWNQSIKIMDYIHKHPKAICESRQIIKSIGTPHGAQENI